MTRVFIIIIAVLFIGKNVDAQSYNYLISDVSTTSNKFQNTALVIKRHMEIAMLKRGNVNIIDRDVISHAEEEREIQKKESFMDGNYVKQGSALGADYIVTMDFFPENEILTINIINVETNEKELVESYKLKRFLTYDYKIERPAFFGRYLEEEVDKLMQKMDIGGGSRLIIYDVVKSDKDRAKEVVLYSEDRFKLNRKDKLEVYVILEDDKNSIYKKKEKIGEVEVTYIESPEVTMAVVKDGEKEIFQLFNEEKTIICVPKF